MFDETFHIFSILLIGVDLDTTIIKTNHTSHRLFVFSEFIQNSWDFDMGMVIFDFQGY